MNDRTAVPTNRMSWTTRPLRVACLTGLVGLAACGDAPESESGHVVTDSAGIRMVMTTVEPQSSWSIDPVPVFQVGWGDEGPFFTWPQSGQITPSNGAVVGEFSEGRLYELDATGAVVRTTGRKGQGPGEFASLDGVLMSGDTVVISDGRQSRLTLLAPDGSVETQQVPVAFTNDVSTILSDSRILLVPGESYSGVTEVRPEWVFETGPIVALDRATGSLDTLAVLPKLKRWYGDRGAPPSPARVHGKAGGFADGFAWARSDQAEVRWFDSDGSVTQIARWSEVLTDVDAAYIDQAVERVTEIMDDLDIPDEQRPMRLAMYRDGLARHDGPAPIWDALSVDREGNVWLRDFGFAGDRQNTWRVVNRDGHLLGRIDLPGVVAILDITNDRMLAVVHDEFDVPAVTMFRLLKP